MASRLFRLFAGAFFCFVVAVCPAGAQVPEESNVLAPALRYSTVKGDAGKFREDWWMRDGWAGGIDELRFDRRLRNDLSLSLYGRAFPEEDYRFRLKLGKTDAGYFLAEYTEFRKYYDGTGGFYRPFEIPPFELENDLRLDVGSILLEAGLTRPGLPEAAVFYENRFRQGNKSLLEWGRVVEGGVSKNIFPSFKNIDEETDIVGLRVGHRMGRVDVGNDFHYERHRTETARFNEERDLDAGAEKAVTVAEDYSHDAFYNAFRVESFIREKVYGSLGYLHSRLRGDAGLRITTVPFGPGPFDYNWFTRAVQVRHDSHVLNLNSMLGPFKDIVVYGGLKAETTDSKGDTDAVLLQTVPEPGTVSPEALIVSDKDKSSLEETLGVRYTGLRYTTIYAEGKWLQGTIDLFEQELEDGALSFERLTDTDRRDRRYTVGLTTSPLRGATFSLRYRRAAASNDYTHPVNSEPGYPAFITAQDFKRNELSARMSFRPLSWTQVSLMYRLFSLETDTAYDAIAGGPVRSGNYDADVYSIRTAIRPVARMHLTGLFSYHDARSKAFDNAAPSVAAWEGDVFTLLLTTAYSIDEQTGLTMEYLYSRSDNAQENILEGLPLGIENRRHGLLLGLSRQIAAGVRTRFQYGYYEYDDQAKDGADDYRAHVLFSSIVFTF
jgi:hypothetical protein